ncbi:MAG: malto-oligosyltrehalose synthase [Alphaproteobacteria bacterium]|nr:malto-oligosyltrehalose synthase [Alphaproteobacteria bacterium]
MHPEASFDERCRRFGIERHYRDFAGQTRESPRETVEALLATCEAAERSATGARIAPPVIVIHEGDEAAHVALFGDTTSAKWLLQEEGGRERSGRVEGSNRLALPGDLPTGYHDLRIEAGGDARVTRLIVTPRRCFMPPALESGPGEWGFAIQLYALRSPRNWGIGDLTDLADFMRRAGAEGAALVGINPLHALFDDEPSRASPYSPSSRRFFNALYLDVEAIDEFAICDAARQLVSSTGFQDRLRHQRAATLVDYTGVARCKHQVLELLYACFREQVLSQGGVRAQAFRAFQRTGGKQLRQFATFQALRAHLAGSDARRRYWRFWPREYQDPESAAVADFTAKHPERIEYYGYLQWQIDLQLDRCREAARSSGMPVGLYCDLAVGIDFGGAEGWAEQGVFAEEWSAGAPPDSMAPSGQEWGLAPMNPVALRATAYDAFITTLRANMRHAGAIRIDHILGLWRLFWVRHGAGPAAGVYVRYPFDDLAGIIALESQRNKCLVIGEDLGLIPDGLHAKMDELGILSYRLLYFEREGDGRFRGVESYPRNALVAVGTHDLVPLAGYWNGTDIAIRSNLGLYPDAERAKNDRRARETDRRQMAAALGVDRAQVSDTSIAQLSEAAYRFLGRTQSRIVVVQLEDALGIREPPNVPGTDREYPNWRRRLPLDMSGLFRHAGFCRLLKVLNEQRPPLVGGAAPASSTAPVRAGAADLDVPTATYRLQFGPHFGFDAATEIVPYLARLGVSHVYASPIFKARPGSTHGYDITDHNALNPEIGTNEAFERFSDTLRAHGMGLILDFVPNHMGIGKADNLWWLDVLEWGQNSQYADFFDIDWMPRREQLWGKILLPLLGDHYGVVLEAGELQLKFDDTSGTFSVWYHEHRLPIRPRHYAIILRRRLSAPDEAENLADDVRENLQRLAGEFDRLRRPARRRRDAVHERAEALKVELAALARGNPAVARFLDTAASSFNGIPGRPRSFRQLHSLLERQVYRLAFWRVAADEINYRRFFNINELAAIRIEQPALFEIAHRLVARLIADDRIQGLRIDHIDGLYDPAAYCRRLRALAADNRARDTEAPFYVVVEKILALHESLRGDWEVAGTTGYEFTNLVNGLFINAEAEQPLKTTYSDFSGETAVFDDVLAKAKQYVIEHLLAGEVNGLSSELDRISERHWSTRDYTDERLHAALRDTAVQFPVYRTYVTEAGAAAEDLRDIDWATSRARRWWPGSDPEIFDFVRAALTTDLAKPRSPYRRAEVVRFAMRFQQRTGPITAKALEDTAFYRYHTLLSLNEVGGDPRQFATTPAAFHHANRQRARLWPHSMLTTATHDTKRGEDARARIDALSEVPQEWGERVRRWSTFNRSFRRDVEDEQTPSANDEYMFYQTLFGAWPTAFETAPSTSSAELTDLIGRLQAFVVKAAREAKVHTSWDRPNENYEGGFCSFVERVLDVSRPNPFLSDFSDFHAELAPAAMLSSLSQLALKLTCPGVPDLYQGCEGWDFSLVDPDNRRPVDFVERAERLAETERVSDPRATAEMLKNWRDGRIKQIMTARLLALRRRLPMVFRGGDYERLDCEGPAAEHVVAYQRFDEAHKVVIVAGRLFVGLDRLKKSNSKAWKETRVALPVSSTGAWRNLFDDARTLGTAESNESVSLANLLGDLPFAVWVEAN